MNLINWSPFQDMDGFFDRYYNLVNRSPSAGSDVMSWRPTVDISETKKAYLIKAELPEVDKDDVDVRIENGMLTISGERHFESEEEDETRHRVERMYGQFARSFTLPNDADEAHISAKSKDGMLKVRIPKVSPAPEETRKVSID